MPVLIFRLGFDGRVVPGGLPLLRVGVVVFMCD